MIEEKKKRLRGVFLLPNLITTSALFSGFYAIVSSINGDFITAALAILIAMVLDGLDGRIARLTNTQTSFGENYDSLSDMICFGLAPAIMLYTWANVNLAFGMDSSKIVLIFCFIYVASAAIRLARFNSITHSQDKKFFIGLASPASSAVIITYVWIVETLVNGNISHLSSTSNYVWVGLFILPVLSFLMISNITYYSFKDFNIRHKVPHITLFLIALFISFISFDPPLVLFSFFLLYALSGPGLYLFRIVKKKKSLSQEKNSTKP
ncbi:MAG: CDP-diacylglycerol--serine O-phosphatidyltransferase [Gammaproteobacteria bacterium]|nr:CDP-diacylglycerol--serine O-phosphatidyltransferase [Gammaproteobacteria bacterium]